MKKVRLYQRKDRPGWHVSWRQNGREIKRALPNKKLAEHFQAIIYHELNTGVLRSNINLPWDMLTARYLLTYDIRRLAPSSKYESGLTLRHFEYINGPVSSKNINQQHLDLFSLERGDLVGDHTLKKDLSNLRAFIRWAQKNNYLERNLAVTMIKVSQRPPVALSTKQIQSLLISARQRSATWYIRILLAITTGLRSSDIDRLKIADLDFENQAIRTYSKKTKKTMSARPMHSALVPILTRYIAELPAGQVKLLADDTHTHKKYKKIRNRAGLAGLRFHDLRSVFSFILQSKDVPLSVVQNLLEHSSPALTERIYTQTNPLLAPAVERLPVNDWLLTNEY
jgi:integrase